MCRWRFFIISLLCALWMPGLSGIQSAGFLQGTAEAATNTRVFSAQGSVVKLKPDEKVVVIRHEAISNFMDAMTMPFKVKDSGQLGGLQPGDLVSFRLNVTETESWVDQITKTGTGPNPENKKTARPGPVFPADSKPANPLLDYAFTNELGQAVRLSEFRGEALAITFIYTRCPLPDYCPRLSKNFQSASQKLAGMAGAPTNWHFLSVSFDPEFDTPEHLRAYAKNYHYDPKRWSFLTGPPDKIGELARQSGVTYELDSGLINHNFRTLIIDAAGHLQMIFPTTGDLSDLIVAEIVKAAAATNPAVARH